MSSTGSKLGPHLIPIGLSIPEQYSTWALSKNLVLSPIQTICDDVAKVLPEIESVLVSADSNGKCNASWLV